MSGSVLPDGINRYYSPVLSPESEEPPEELPPEEDPPEELLPEPPVEDPPEEELSMVVVDELPFWEELF